MSSARVWTTCTIAKRRPVRNRRLPKIRYVSAGLSLHLYEVGSLGCVRLTTGHVICSPVTVCKNMKPRRGRNAIMEPDRTIPDRPRRRRRQRPDGVAAAAATSAILSARRLGVRGASLGDSIKRNGRNLAAVPAGVRRFRIALTAVARPPHPRQRYERRRRRPWPDICRTPEISPHWHPLF